MKIHTRHLSILIWLMVLLAFTPALFCDRAQAQEKKRRSLQEVQQQGGSQGIADIFSEDGRAAEAQRWDLVFYRTTKLPHALDYLEEIERVLEERVVGKLRMVKDGAGNFGIVRQMGRKKSFALKTAKALSGNLEEAGLQPVTVEPHAGHVELFNVVYYKGEDEKRQKKVQDNISRILGLEVNKKLVIEKSAEGGFSLVYRAAPARESSPVLAKAQEEEFEKYRQAMEAGQAAFPGDSNDRRTGAGRAGLAVDFSKGPADLENRIRKFIASLRREGKLVSDEQTSWSVVDFSTGELLVSINEQTPRQTASMVKPFVALAFFHEAAAGNLSYSAAFRRYIERMIQRSDNVSTNWVMKKIGGPDAIDSLLRRHYQHIFKDTRIEEYIPLTIVERQRAKEMGIPKVPAGRSYYRNRASAMDYSRFLNKLWQGELPYADEIKRIMALPNRDRVYNGAKKVPKGTLVYDKTGSTARLCGDMAILSAADEKGNRYAYTLVGIIEKKERARDYISWKNDRADVIREVSNMVYSYQKGRYNLM